MLVVIISFTLCLILFFVRLGTNKKNNIALCNGYLPIIGHTHMMVGDTKKLLRSIKSICVDANKKDGIAIFVLGLSDYYVITDPEDAFKVKHGTIRKHYLFKFASSWLGDGLVTSEGEIWKRHRKLLGPAFSQQTLNSFVSIFNRQARILVSNIENEMQSGPVEIVTLFKLTALKIIYLTIFGKETEADTFNQDYMAAVDEFLAIVLKRAQNLLLHNDFFFKISGWKRKEDRVVKKLLDMSKTVISKNKEDLLNEIDAEANYETELKYKPMLKLMLKSLNDTEIREEIDTIIGAGYDTTSWALSVLLVILGSYPEIQDKVYKEIISILDDSADVDTLNYAQLVYCEAVIKESLRLYPIFPLTLRQTEIELKLRNFTLPANSHCFIGIYGINRHPVWGPDADTFRPERWLEPGGVPENANAYASFGLGRRTCIGKTFALMAMKTLLVHIIRRYKVTADISKMEFKLDVLMTPVENCKVEFELRNASE